MMRRRAALLTLAALVAGTSRARVARAVERPPLNVEISVIHALRTDGGVAIDPELRDLPQLTREQPFVRYNVFRLLDRKRFPLERGKPVGYGLVDGRTLQVTLLEVTGQNGDARYRMRAEIAGAGKTEFLKLLEVTAGPNEPFFVAGQSHAGGTLFLELTLRA
jgi:hypothetical protein